MFDSYRQARRWQTARPAIGLQRPPAPTATDWRFAWLPHGEGSTVAVSAALALPVVALSLELLRFAVGW